MCLDSGGGGAGRPAMPGPDGGAEAQGPEERDWASAWRGRRGGGSGWDREPGGVPAQCPVNGQARGCVWAGRARVGEGTRVCGSLGPVAMETPPIDKLSRQPLGADPVGASRWGRWRPRSRGTGTRGGFPLLYGLQAVNSRRGLGRESGEEGVVEAGKGRLAQREGGRGEVEEAGLGVWWWGPWGWGAGGGHHS